MIHAKGKHKKNKKTNHANHIKNIVVRCAVHAQQVYLY